MRKIFTLTIASILFFATTQAQMNIELLGHLSYPVDLSNLWGWADGAGHEYALVGTGDGTSIVDITDPASPTEVQFIDGNNSIWREVRTWSHYAYVVTENGGGLLCIDLSGLPGSVTYNYTDCGIGINTGHTVFCDENGVVHIFGSNLGNQGDYMFDATADPLNPTYIGKVDTWYIHDGYVSGDTLWAGNIYDGWFSVWNISDKASPLLLGQQSTPNTFTHNVAVSADNHYVYSTDEVAGASVGSFDVSDLTDIKLIDEFQSTPGTDVIPHNTYVHGNFLVTSYYTDGVILTDATHPENLIKTGFYDTSPDYAGGTFNGCWGVCPSLPSGVIIASDIEKGLYVLQPTYIQACYLSGTVIDLSTEAPIYDVSVSITLDPDAATTTNLTGEYETGVANAGSYDVTFLRSGYAPKTITGVSLTNGITTTLDVGLYPLTPFALSGQVVDSETGVGIANAQVQFDGVLSDFAVTADASGNFTLPTFFADTYTYTAGQWGYNTKQSTPTDIVTPTPLTIALDKGYYDDFFFDYDWTVASDCSAGFWVRDVPIETNYEGTVVNPGQDVDDDFGDDCFVTGNGGGEAGSDDVDNGYTILSSPLIDLSTYENPHLYYSRWFYNGYIGFDGADSLTVYISNGTETVLADQINHTSDMLSQWVNVDLRIKDFVPLTNNMHILFRTAETVGAWVEGGVDKFYIVDSLTINAINDVMPSADLSAYPNPFTNSCVLHTDIPSTDTYSLELTDITGRVLDTQLVQGGSADINTGKNLSAGIYFSTLKKDGITIKTIKLIKQ